MPLKKVLKNISRYACYATKLYKNKSKLKKNSMRRKIWLLKYIPLRIIMQYKIFKSYFGKKIKKALRGEGEITKNTHYTPLEGFTLKIWREKHFIKNIWIYAAFLKINTPIQAYLSLKLRQMWLRAVHSLCLPTRNNKLITAFSN